MNMQIFEWGS